MIGTLKKYLRLAEMFCAFLAMFASGGLLVHELGSTVPVEPGSPVMAMAGANFLGEQHIGAYDRLLELASAASSNLIAAGACKQIDVTPAAMSYGEEDAMWGAAIFSYDGIDASTPCDGGVCGAFLTSLAALDLHGSLCLAGGASCTSCPDGSIADVSQQSWPSGGATAYGGTEHLVYNCSTGTIALQVCAGSLPARVQGRVSGQRVLRVPGSSDSGSSDSGSSSGGSSSGGSGSSSSSGGSAPTITSINVSSAIASGGEIRCAAGNHFTDNGTATVTVDSVSATVSGSPSNTSICWTMPASAVSATNGNTAISTVTVTNTGGPTSTTGTYPSGIWYVPQCGDTDGGAPHPYAFSYSAQNVTTSAGNIATVADNSGNGYTLTPVTAGPPYTATGGGGSGNLPYWTHPANTTDNRLINSSVPAANANGTGTFVVGFRSPASGPTGTAYIWRLGTLSTDNSALYVGTSSSTILTSLGNNAVVTYSASTDNFIFAVNNPPIATNTLNGGSPAIGTQTNTTWGGSVIIGGESTAGGGGANYNSVLSMYEIFWCPGIYSGTQQTNFGDYFAWKGE